MTLSKKDAKHINSSIRLSIITAGPGFGVTLEFLQDEDIIPFARLDMNNRRSRETVSTRRLYCTQLETDKEEQNHTEISFAFLDRDEKYRSKFASKVLMQGYKEFKVLLHLTGRNKIREEPSRDQRVKRPRPDQVTSDGRRYTANEYKTEDIGTQDNTTLLKRQARRAPIRDYNKHK
ncbi:hypothetical protein J6590_083415 [Homalodisca vitripennis]|nr:hypothetical protein J6590_083415 [Homalodisca vitripennis]